MIRIRKEQTKQEVLVEDKEEEGRENRFQSRQKEKWKENWKEISFGNVILVSFTGKERIFR